MTITKVVAVAAIVLAGYMVVIALPDVKRYLRIRSM